LASGEEDVSGRKIPVYKAFFLEVHHATGNLGRPQEQVLLGDVLGVIKEVVEETAEWYQLLYLEGATGDS